MPGKVFKRVILERVKDIVNSQLRDQQAGFRIYRSCTDQIANLRIIVEQSLEWNSSLYINFDDYEKTFNSVDRKTLWKLLWHYGIPTKLVFLIMSNYEGMTSQVINKGQFSRHVQVQTSVWQRAVYCPFRFLAGHRLDHENDNQAEKEWNPMDIMVPVRLPRFPSFFLLSHNHQQMQDRTTTL